MVAQQPFGEDKSRRTIVIIVALVAALAVGGLFYVLMSKSAAPSIPTRLADAIRAGSPEYDEYKARIPLDPPEAEESKRALGDWMMTLRTVARNFSGRTITGLEVHAAVVDHQGQPVKERTVVMIPGRLSELEPNKTMPIFVTLDGMSDEDDRANIKMDVTAFKFK